MQNFAEVTHLQHRQLRQRCHEAGVQHVLDPLQRQLPQALSHNDNAN